MRHLIDSADWTLEDIDELWSLTRRLKHREKLKGIDQCLAGKAVMAIGIKAV